MQPNWRVSYFLCSIGCRVREVLLDGNVCDLRREKKVDEISVNVEFLFFHHYTGCSQLSHSNNNNYNNIYVLKYVCHPVVMVILLVYKIWNWLLINLSREGYMRSMESWEPSQHLLLDTGKSRKTCVEVTSRRPFRILTSSQQSGI